MVSIVKIYQQNEPEDWATPIEKVEGSIKLSNLLNILLVLIKGSYCISYFVQSIIEKSSIPISITPLAENNLDEYSEEHTDGTNKFTYRFLVPYLIILRVGQFCRR